MPDAEPVWSLGAADNTVFANDGHAKLLAIDNNINGETTAEIDSSAPRFPSINIPTIRNIIPNARVCKDPKWSTSLPAKGPSTSCGTDNEIISKPDIVGLKCSALCKYILNNKGNEKYAIQ